MEDVIDESEGGEKQASDLQRSYDLTLLHINVHANTCTYTDNVQAQTQTEQRIGEMHRCAYGHHPMGGNTG